MLSARPGKPVLLVTGTLDPKATPQVALRQVAARTRHYLEGLLAFTGDDQFDEVVFAINCGTPVNVTPLRAEFERAGKRFELVRADARAETLWRGKGHGEGALVSQTLERSELLRSADEFTKITGKLYAPDLRSRLSGPGGSSTFVWARKREAGGVGWLRSSAQPLARWLFRNERFNATLVEWTRRNDWRGRAAGVSGYVGNEYVDTRSYRVDRRMYLECLAGVHRLVSDRHRYNLEYAFRDALLGPAARGHAVIRVSGPLALVGISGSSGGAEFPFPADIQDRAGRLLPEFLTTSHV